MDLVELDRTGTPDDVTAVAQLYRGDLKWTLKNLGRKLSMLGGKKVKPAVQSDWRGMRVFEVRGDQSNQPTMRVGENHFSESASPSSPQELAKYVAWGMEKYPAKHYAVILGGHGSQEGVMSDAYGHKMTFDDAAGAIVKASRQTGRKVDVVLLDSCSTASQKTAGAFRGATEYVVASPEIVQGGGWSESSTLGFLKQNPGSTPEQLAESLVSGHHPSVKSAKSYRL
jgi:Clostripain family